MKQIIWIYSTNSNGMAPFGYGPTLTPNQSINFQENMQACFPSDIACQFISFDTANEVIPTADLLVFNDIDSKYLSTELKENALMIPFQQIMTSDLASLEKSILHALEANERSLN